MKTENDNETMLTISATARKLKRSRNTIHRWITAGLPVHKGKLRLSEVLAFAACRRRGPESPHLAKLARESAEASDPAAATVRTELEGVLSALETGEGVEAALKRLKHVERVAFTLLASAQRTGDPAGEQLRAKLHVDAVSAMVKCEGLIDQRKEIDAQAWTRIQQEFVQWSLAPRAMLDQMPRELASRCNPADSAVAHVALAEWTDRFYKLLNSQPTAPEKHHE